MLKEILVVMAMYLTVLAGHSLHNRYVRYRARKEEEKQWASALDAYSPLYRPDDCKPGVVGRVCKHATALLIAIGVHPVTGETIKGYIIHLLIYSGYTPLGH